LRGRDVGRHGVPCRGRARQEQVAQPRPHLRLLQTPQTVRNEQIAPPTGVSTMNLSRTITLCLVLWLVVISFLHAWLNWGTFDKKPVAHSDRPKFRVGYLPVT